jgi:hypothetical protein
MKIKMVDTEPWWAKIETNGRSHTPRRAKNTP